MPPREITLYYFPSSYYSLKALLALYEKSIPFKHKILDLSVGEQISDDFLLKNPQGEVPLLEIDGEYIAESEMIIDYVDQTFTSGTQLVPDLETGTGQDVRDFRQMLDDVDIYTITFGILANRNLCVEPVTLPSVFPQNRESVQKYLEGVYRKLQEMQKTCKPELIPSIERKLQINRAKLESAMSGYTVSRCLEDLQHVFDRIETQLSNSRTANRGEDAWLFGSSFTAADITAVILMFRLTLLGVAPKFFSETTRPAVKQYYTQLMKRPSVCKVTDIAYNTQKLMAGWRVKPKTVLEVGLVIGLVVVGFLGYRKFTRFIKA